MIPKCQLYIRANPPRRVFVIKMFQDDSLLACRYLDRKSGDDGGRMERRVLGVNFVSTSTLSLSNPCPGSFVSQYLPLRVSPRAIQFDSFPPLVPFFSKFSGGCIHQMTPRCLGPSSGGSKLAHERLSRNLNVIHNHNRILRPILTSHNTGAIQ
jgi:hypothetical protein